MLPISLQLSRLEWWDDLFKSLNFHQPFMRSYTIFFLDLWQDQISSFGVDCGEHEYGGLLHAHWTFAIHFIEANQSIRLRHGCSGWHWIWLCGCFNLFSNFSISEENGFWGQYQHLLNHIWYAGIVKLCLPTWVIWPKICFQELTRLSFTLGALLDQPWWGFWLMLMDSERLAPFSLLCNFLPLSWIAYLLSDK